MSRFFLSFILVFVLGGSLFSNQLHANELTIAIEFNTHAACAYVAMEKGIYEQEGIKIKGYEAYVTGVALAAALSKGGIDAAYMCLVPAVNAYANASVPIRIVSGTHLYGYGLVVNPQVIRNVSDLQSKEVRIGCLREGTSADALLLKTIDKFQLDEKVVASKVFRMNPISTIIAIRTGKLDAAFLPEHWATLAENEGFKMLLRARDVWDNMIGSVLVVKESLIKEKPDLVRRLVSATKKATVWLNRNLSETAEILSTYLAVEAEKAGLKEGIDIKGAISAKADTIRRSMTRLEYKNEIERKEVLETTEFLYRKGYLKKPIEVDKLLDLSFAR